MKKLLVLFVFFTAIISLTSCGEREKPDVTHPIEWVKYSGKFDIVNDSIAVIRVDNRKTGPVTSVWKLDKTSNRFVKVK